MARTAKQIADSIKKTSDDYYAERISEREFARRTNKLWDEASASLKKHARVARIVTSAFKRQARQAPHKGVR